jgi:hypothetical protein
MTKRLLYYRAGFAIGFLLSLLVSYLIGKPSLVWSTTCGHLGGELAIAWAQHRGVVPSPEEIITLFPPEEKHGPATKR